MEGRGEMIGAARKNRSGRTEIRNQDCSASSSAFSFSFVEEIRRKLELEQKSAWNSEDPARGSSCDNPADSCCNYNLVSGTNSYPVSEQERNEHLENNVNKFEDLSKPVRSNKQQHLFQPRSILSREEDKKQTKHNPTPPDLDPSQEEKQEIDKLLKNNKTAMESAAKTRKKILRRSSKIEVETPPDRSSYNCPEPQSNSQHQNIRADGKTKLNTGRMIRSKPILKRSDNFEISVDKNSILRSSESVRKVLHKDLSLGGKLLHTAYNDISFDSSFRPVHR